MIRLNMFHQLIRYAVNLNFLSMWLSGGFLRLIEIIRKTILLPKLFFLPIGSYIK